MTATSIADLRNNFLLEVRFSKRASNAAIEVNGQPVNLNSSAPGDFVSVTLPPNTTTFSFKIRRQNPALGATVPVVVVDVCGGDWPSLVGGGLDAFR